MNTLYKVIAFFLGIGIFTAQFASQAYAEDVSDDFSEYQAYLNQVATEATNAMDYQKAEILFRAMLELGEFNVTWLNLGRTYARQGKCLEARDAYNRVRSAPKINRNYLDPDAIETSLTRFTQELTEDCSAIAVIHCSPEDMIVSVDSGAERPCDGEKLYIKPGVHVFDGRIEDGSGVKILYEVQNSIQNDVELKIIEKIIEIDNWEEDSRIYTSVGYSLLAGGVIIAAAVAGVWGYEYSYYKNVVNNPYHEDYVDGYAVEYFDEMSQKIPIYGSVFGVAGALILSGAGLLIADHVKFGEKKKAAKMENNSLAELDFVPSFYISPEFSGIGFTGRF